MKIKVSNRPVYGKHGVIVPEIYHFINRVPQKVMTPLVNGAPCTIFDSKTLWKYQILAQFLAKCTILGPFSKKNALKKNTLPWCYETIEAKKMMYEFELSNTISDDKLLLGHPVLFSWWYVTCQCCTEQVYNLKSVMW